MHGLGIFSQGMRRAVLGPAFIGGAFLFSGAPLRIRALVESQASPALKHEITDQYVNIEINEHHRIAVAAQIVVATSS
jgi:hypothetical protein